MKFPSTVVLSLPLVAFMLGSPGLAEDWPRWRGPNRDGISTETGLVKQWPEKGPKIAWQGESAGIGYSSVVVSKGRVITQGDLDGVEHIIAFDEKDGSVLWAVQPEPVAKALEEQVSGRFDQYDKDGDGKLNELEALNAMGSNFNRYDTAELGDKSKIAGARVAAFLKLVDENNDGILSPAEAPRGLQDIYSRIDTEDKQADGIALAKQRAEAAVSGLDKDLDFKISRKEANGTVLNRIFNKVDQRDKSTNKSDGQLTEDELRTYFFSREAGRDGVVSAQELTQYYERNYPSRDGVLLKSDLKRAFGGYRNGTGDGPRGTPTIDGNLVFAEGGNGDLTCLDIETGQTLWHVNLTKDFGGGRPGWGYCESPLVVGDLLVVTPGGKNGTVAALNKKTGEVAWRSTDVKEGAHYSSPLIAEIAGTKQIVQFARRSVFGVALDGGRLLWNYSGANNGTANIATPIVTSDYVLASSAYGTGSGLVKISAGAEKQDAKEVYFQKKVANHHGGLVKVGDYVYGFGSGLMCMNFLTGEIAWQKRSVGKGSLVYADGMLYCLGERHEVALVEANPKEYVEHGRFKIESHGRPAWAHPVVANGRFYIRDQQQLTAYDVEAAK